MKGGFAAACKDRRVWALFLIYGACFGIELTINNVAALYFSEQFGLGLAAAGVVASLFGLGLSPKLGPMRDWGLNINRESIEVNTIDYQTNIPGIYAIGDINHYPGKLRLILCGFHEATLMVQSAYKRIHPDKNLVLKYTTVTGVQELPES
jgi:hypothetical protein